MKINGPVNEPPITPITRSKRGRISAIKMPNATITVLSRHLFKEISGKLD